MSKPIGFLSGLCYLLWLDEKYIPRKTVCGCEHETTRKNHMQTELKKFLTEVDKTVDPLISTKTQALYLDMLYGGRFLEMAENVGKILTSLPTSAYCDQLFSKFLNALSSMKMRPNEKAQIKLECRRLMDGRYGIGNSYVFVLKRDGG